MIIEFIGLPGSGKTFLSKTLCDVEGFERATIKKVTLKKRISYFISKIRYRVFWSFFFKILVSKNNLSDSYRRLYGLILLDPYLKNSNTVNVYDQHLLQYLVSFYMVTGIKPEFRDIVDLAKYYKMPKSIIIVYINPDLNHVLRRFKERKNSLNHNETLLDKLNDEDLFDYMNKLKALNENLLESILPLQFKVIEYKEPQRFDFLLKELKREIL